MEIHAHHEIPTAIFNGLSKLIQSGCAPGTHVSMLWPHADGKCLRHLAAPTLPEAYAAAINGLAIESDDYPFARALRAGQRVLVEDIEVDQRWRAFREVALAAGLRACWIEPIRMPGGKIMGAFAIYREAPGKPNTAELDLLDTAVQMAIIAIRDLRNDDEIRFQATLLDSVHEAVVATDPDGMIRYWGRGAAALFNCAMEKARGARLDSIIDLAAGLAEARAQGEWNGRLVIADSHGPNRTLEVSVSSVVDSLGESCGFVAILRDISERLAAEQRAGERSRQHRLVAYLGRIALGDIELQALLDFTVESLARVLEVPLCKVLELDPDGNSLLLRAGIGWKDGLVGVARVDANSTTQAGFTLASATPVVVENLRREQRFSGPPLLFDHGVVSGMSVVIHGQDDSHYGVLGVHATEYRCFSEHDINFLQSVANVLAESIRRTNINASLRRSEQRFRDLADAMPQLIWSADTDGHCDYLNDRWRRLQEALGDANDPRDWLGSLHPEDRLRWISEWEACARQRLPIEMECRVLVEKPARYRWHLLRALPVQAANGMDFRWYGSGTDIDDQKRIEHRLREQARELEMVNWINATLATELDFGKLVQTVIDVGTQLSGARFGAYFHGTDAENDDAYSLYALSGISPEQLGELNLRRVKKLFESIDAYRGVIRENDIRGEELYANDAAEPGKVDMLAVRSYLAVPVVSRNGVVLGGILFGHTDGGVFDTDDERLIAGLATQAAIAVEKASVYQDLRDSKNAVHRQYEQLNAIYASAPVGLCFLDERLRIVSINEHFCALSNCTRSDVIEKDLTEALADVAAELEPLCRDALSRRMPTLNMEICWRDTGSGGTRYWLCSCYPILEQDGTVLGINTVVQDITERKQGELDLARLGSIVDNSYDAIVGKTLQGKITSWNRGAERLYGYSAQEIIGKSITLIIPDDRRQEESEIMHALHAGRHVALDDTLRIRKDGKIVRVSLTISPIRNKEGDIVGASTIARDITASKLAERAARENEARMRLILQATQIGTWDWEIDSGKVRWSDNMENLHGRQAGSFDGTFESALSDIYPDDKELVGAAIARALENGGDYKVEYRIIADDGGIRWIEGKGQVLYDSNGAMERMVGICMNVTERKEAEQTLRNSETLLRAQTEELATADRQKDEFLAMLAHELRNPLAPISNAVQLLKVQKAEEREARLPWAIEVIDRQVLQLSRLVDDLLNIARIKRGQIELKSELLDLRDVARQAAETASGWFDAKQQTFEINCPEHPIDVCIDGARIVQAVSNLLSNASNYTAESGRIALRVYCQGDDAVIVVEDTGIGIPADTLPHVFDLFAQADRPLDRRQGGLGLGLSWVKKLVEMHAGRIFAASPGLGRGSEFTIRLPLAKAADRFAVSRAARVQAPAADAAHAARILVVDDNAQATDAMAMLLETLGHTVQKAYDGRDALRVAEKFMPDMVFLDIGLPLMDGYEVAQRLRARFGADMTLIALTGYAPQQMKQRTAEANFDQYILKPISLDKLISLLT